MSEFQFEGRTQNRSPFSGQEVPATGHVLRLGGTIVLMFSDDGLISSERQYWDVYPLVEVWIGLGVINV